MGRARPALFTMDIRFNRAVLIVVAVLMASPVVAQVNSEGGIITKPLEPPAGAAAQEGDSPDSRFKKAPFKTPGIPRQPERIEPIDTSFQAGARMRQLDKMTGRIQTFEIATGAEMLVDRLRLRLEACRAPEGNSEHGAMAFLEIWDTKRADDGQVFSGWMFADSPALSALDHPRYDLWMINCTTSPGEVPTASE